MNKESLLLREVTVAQLKPGDVIYGKSDYEKYLIILRVGRKYRESCLVTFFRAKNGEIVTQRYFNSWIRHILVDSSSES